MKAVKLMLISLSIFILIGSCKKDDGKAINQPSSFNIPNTVGDYWKYSMLSATGAQEGILEVRVIAKNMMPNGDSVTTWVYAYPTFTDTVFKVLTDTSFDEYTSDPSLNEDYFRDMRYALPMVVGNQYALFPNLYSDSVKVVSDSVLTVPAGRFEHTIQHDFIGTHYIGNYWNNSQYWFTPNIGETRMEKALFNLGPDEHNGIYELLEYHLN
jgi:hypothetical protein